MHADEWFVGSVAICIGALSVGAACSAFPRVYQLRSVKAMYSRFGNAGPRILFLVIAATMFAAGAAILSGTRPSIGSDIDLNEAADQGL